LAAKHLRLDPYELWHVGWAELPPHPRPRIYRTLVFAMAEWLEEREIELSVKTSTGAALSAMFKPERKPRPKRPPRRRPRGR
jgi:hypothetical protein